MKPTFEKLFGFDTQKHNVRTEILAGITTFLTMAYILAVNPTIFSALPGMPGGSVFTATALAAIIGTLVMALYAKKPFALAPGMGLNAFFVYTVCMGMGYSWQFALTAVLIEGLIFILLTVTKVRSLLLKAIPGTLIGIQGQLDPVVSICLGPCEVSVKEMVDAYTTFPNHGIRIDPLYVSRIEDKQGNVIATFHPQQREIISELTSYKMIYMLRNVMDHGTGVRARFKYGLKMPTGGKTGTTQNNSDGWFVGFTPSLVSGCWVGGEDRAIHFDRMSDGQGASMALPIWALYMQKVLADEELPYDEAEQFDVPITFDAEAGCR